MNMVYMKLGDICSPKQWKTISTSELTSEGYPVYGANGIIGYYKEFNHIKETILVTCRGATCGSVNITRPYSYVNGNAMALDNLDERFDINYLYFYLSYRGFNDVISGSAQPQIIRSAIEKILIPLYPIEQQRKIASLFIKINNIHDLYRKENDRLDELIKSRFVEMFGDPVSNPLKWTKKSLKDVCIKLNDGTHFSPESFETGEYRYVTAKNIKRSGFDFTNITYVSEKVHRPIYERCNPEKGDVLYIKDGVTTGIAMVNTLEDEFTLLSSVALLKQDRKIMNGYFLASLLNDKNMYSDIRGNMGGAAITRLTIAKLNTIKVIVPPIELQNQFAEFVIEVDKSKSAVQAALDKTQLLFDSLMQEYFG